MLIRTSRLGHKNNQRLLEVWAERKETLSPGCSGSCGWEIGVPQWTFEYEWFYCRKACRNGHLYSPIFAGMPRSYALAVSQRRAVAATCIP